MKRLKTIGNFIFTALLISILATPILIALPQTESVVSTIRYDLTFDDQNYFTKSYLLQFDGTDRVKLEQSKNVIYNRLRRYGADQIKIEDTSAKEEEIESVKGMSYVKVTVTGKGDETNINALVSRRNYLRLLGANEDFVPDSEDLLALYLPENYEFTQFNRRAFRHILIKQFPSTDGTEAYFTVYKSWPHTSKQFQKFLFENAGKRIGISIDGFVTPYTVPSQFLTEPTPQAPFPEFAPGLTENSQEAQVSDLLFNSGVIPLKYSVLNEETIERDQIEIEYLQLVVSVLTALLAVLIFRVARSKRLSYQAIRPTLLSALAVAALLTYHKIATVEINLFQVSMAFILTFLFNNVYTEINRAKFGLINLGLGSLILSLLGEGIVRNLGLNVGLLLLLTVGIDLILKSIEDNISKIVRK